MKCGRLQLVERGNARAAAAATAAGSGGGAGAGAGAGAGQRPRKFCQRRLVNPAHDEDPRWTNVYQRFHCLTPEPTIETPSSNEPNTPQFEDLFLSVQNLKFQGNEQQKKRQRSGFKLKKVDDGKIHRMFVKQNVVIDNLGQSDEDCSSQLTCYYYDDCAKYLQNYGRPFSSKSNYSFFEIKNERENKAVQVELTNNNNTRKKLPRDIKSNKRQMTKIQGNEGGGVKSELDNDLDGDTRVCFHRSENKKSLTIARAQSPESVQVIRVDVVCAHAASPPACAGAAVAAAAADDGSSTTEQPIEKLNLKKSHLEKKYLLSNTMKNLDERVSGGSKVTLLCKTFRLSDRSKQSDKQRTISKLQLKK